ncbi:SDR family NAD(P)-dependent oxidoreductase [Amphiplicatus metriothermophilus]|uniref:NAD(P)-dependent dehydrogenase, short-chain alcohol dehydrogenase family n=1 Tax=Amphiplicatus metriothermophilus TaxID=1519374 RepID=A0A239PYE9_9PROT|nr:SDR family oxidoreductase [Amphiplicatus metriothermophilus]MBB5519831.1 NAD(P)-dependent dehydrogenase (short-subunit alcohol dehydrogenase family) [Amphiplicatus metriothermophilus]SNT75118.1 NAD(P)-dependent dehydrogenase, short-chain alcohol dehydrogenase family [Amphiplicatus metriothermophilus]
MTRDYLNFEGKTALVTGAAAGIGAAVARAFAERGAAVVMADIDGRRNEKTAADIAAATGAAVEAVACDVADDKDCAGLVETALVRFGRVDTLVNNAGIVAAGGALDLDPEDFDRVLRVNLRAAFMLTRLAARSMIERKIPGAIVNMSSINAVVAIANQAAYVTSKGGLQQFTKVTALELAPHGIRVNAVGPGSIMTDILKSVARDAAARRKILSRTPLGRIGDPEEVAAVALFLASDMASYVTGETIYVDGGRLALNYVVPAPEEA